MIALKQSWLMRKLKSVLRVLLIVLVPLASVYAIWCSVGRMATRREVRTLVTPVLNAAFLNDDTNEGWIRLEDRLEVVLKDRSDAGDEALAILCQYYLGEHNAEEISANVTQRGRRILPYLEKYRNNPGIALRPEFLLLRLSRADRTRWDDYLIGLIHEGKVLQE